MKFVIDYNNMMKDTLGEQGLTEQDLVEYSSLSTLAKLRVEQGRGSEMQGWMDLPYNQAEVIEDINATSKYVRDNFEYFVVLGIGGSALGPQAVFCALNHLYHNDLPKEVRNAPKFYVVDNVDPEKLTALLDVIDITKTMFNVITKSGSTSETMSQYLLIMQLLTEKLGNKAREHIIATTSKVNGNLIKLAKQNNFKTFYIPEGVGGRFSELCPVGLLPAAVLNVNIAEFLEGARQMDEVCKSAKDCENPALMSAVLQYASMQRGKNISVMMPYADSLRYVSDWYCQLWAESLGKSVHNDKTSAFVGQTPVKALGVTDQHSQMQLYTEGPFDKVITFIEVEKYRSTVIIPEGCQEYPNVNFLCGHTFNELITKELYASKFALTKAHRANYTIVLSEVNAYTLGQLLYYFMLQTAYAGAMLDIDAYNQPGVEEGKNATYALFGRQGYESKRQELDNAVKPNTKYIIG